MNPFVTSPWKNGSQNHITGAGFGIKIPLGIRSSIFKKAWKNVILVMDENEYEVEITPGFWNKCSEIRSKEIGKWLIKHDIDRWHRGHPPRIKIEHQGGNRFEVSK